MAEITPSRMAMYEGIIALAWADHSLHPDEQEELHRLIDSNLWFTEEQKDKLHAEIDSGIKLQDVWPNITEKADRAFLLDIASLIFHKDGEYCSKEKALYDEFLSKHMETLDVDRMQNEIADLAQLADEKRVFEQQEMKEYAKQFGLFKQIGRYLNKL